MEDINKKIKITMILNVLLLCFNLIILFLIFALESELNFRYFNLTARVWEIVTIILFVYSVYIKTKQRKMSGNIVSTNAQISFAIATINIIPILCIFVFWLMLGRGW